MVVATIVGISMLYVANIGDSRYCRWTEQIRQITRDHSLVDEMVRMGEITAMTRQEFIRTRTLSRELSGQK